MTEIRSFVRTHCALDATSARQQLNNLTSEEDAHVRVPSRGRHDRDWPLTDHNDLAVCTHFFWRLEIIIILRRDTARSKVVSIKKWRPQNGIGDGGGDGGIDDDGRGASGIWRSASPGDLLRSVVGAAERPLRRLSAPIRRDINECFCARATE